jgi:hypothetical protein
MESIFPRSEWFLSVQCPSHATSSAGGSRNWHNGLWLLAEMKQGLREQQGAGDPAHFSGIAKAAVG